MKLKRQLLVLLAFCLALVANAQITLIQGLKLPQLTTAQRDLIQKQGDPNNPYANGQTIYNLDNNCMEYWNGTEWVSFCGEPPCVPVTSVEITSDPPACMSMGASFNMTATPADGTWLSSNPAVATIDPATGELTLVAAGTTMILYSYTDTTDCTAKDTKIITVNAKPTVSITSTATSTCMGANLNMTATPADGAWSSGTPATATIHASTGELTPVAAGTTVITYSYTNDNGCSDTDTKTITVDAALAQSNPTAVSICNGATHTFTLAAATGGSGVITYQWQSSADNTTWTNISGATDANYTTPALTANTYYRRQATAATCGGMITSTAALVTIAATFTQGNPAAASICNGATRAFTLAAASGGSGTITYQWQSSANNSTWTNISGATSANYTTPALTASTYYRRQATAATCGGTISSASALVTVAAVLTQPNPTGASKASGTTHTFSLGAASGGSGTITYQWQSSSNNSTWANISGATGATYTTPALTASTYYRRQATAATCGGTITSASALVTVIAAVKVGNYIWATRNLTGSGARGGTFVANVYDHGMVYQFNRSKGWPSTGTVTGWNSTPDPGSSWAVGNDPCPAGFRVPTSDQIVNLITSTSKMYLTGGQASALGLGGSYGGQIIGPGASATSFNPATQIYLPTVRTRYADGAEGAGYNSYYWSSTASGNTAYCMYWLSAAVVGYSSYWKEYGCPIRCVAE